jgi:hypothetical protein
MCSCGCLQTVHRICECYLYNKQQKCEKIKASVFFLPFFRAASNRMSDGVMRARSQETSVHVKRRRPANPAQWTPSWPGACRFVSEDSIRSAATNNVHAESWMSHVRHRRPGSAVHERARHASLAHLRERTNARDPLERRRLYRIQREKQSGLLESTRCYRLQVSCSNIFYHLERALIVWLSLHVPSIYTLVRFLCQLAISVLLISTVLFNSLPATCPSSSVFETSRSVYSPPFNPHHLHSSHRQAAHPSGTDSTACLNSASASSPPLSTTQKSP